MGRKPPRSWEAELCDRMWVGSLGLQDGRAGILYGRKTPALTGASENEPGQLSFNRCKSRTKTVFLSRLEAGGS